MTLDFGSFRQGSILPNPLPFPKELKRDHEVVHLVKQTPALEKEKHILFFNVKTFVLIFEEKYYSMTDQENYCQLIHHSTACWIQKNQTGRLSEEVIASLANFYFYHLHKLPENLRLVYTF